VRYIVAKVYSVEYAHKLTNLYTKLYGYTLITETSSYSINNVVHLEVRIYSLDVNLHDVRAALYNLHTIYGREDKLTILNSW
jgi:hypothetical protein